MLTYCLDARGTPLVRRAHQHDLHQFRSPSLRYIQGKAERFAALAFEVRTWQEDAEESAWAQGPSAPLDWDDFPRS